MLVNRESISFSRKIILVNKKAPCTIKKELSKRSNRRLNAQPLALHKVSQAGRQKR